MTEPETVPNWVLTEVGRLHLHALALERELLRRQHGDEEPDPKPAPAEEPQ